MQIDQKLSLLKKIQEQEAPPFLLTRIRQRIQNINNMPAPFLWKWAFAASAVIIITLNISVFFRQDHSASKPGIETVVSSMSLSNTNILYYE